MVDKNVLESQYTSQKIKGNQSKSPPCQNTSGTAPSKLLNSTKDLKLHKLIFEEGGLMDGTEVTCCSDEKGLLFGYKKSNGILCSCCDKNISPSQFEDHAGKGRQRKPYSNICLKNGTSLHEVALYLRTVAEDKGVLGAYDEKVWLCIGCRSLFRNDSASSQINPPTNWCCSLCQRKDKKRGYNSDIARRVSRVDPSRTCNVRNSEENISCFLCTRSQDCNFQFGPHEVVTCHLCQKQYHMCCLKKHRISDLKVEPMGKWFCFLDCRRISSYFQTVIEAQEREFTDSLLQRKRKKQNNTSEIVRWRLLPCTEITPKDKLLRDDMLLKKAHAILDGSFDRVVDSVSGCDLIEDMVLGKSGQHNVFCAVVTVNSSVVAAGLLRVLGQNFADLPLAATGVDSRRQGYFRQLITGIEDTLKACGIHRFVLPATKHSKKMWVQKFGFEEMSKEERKYYEENCWRRIEFRGTTLLQKVIDSEAQSNRRR